MIGKQRTARVWQVVFTLLFCASIGHACSCVMDADILRQARIASRLLKNQQRLNVRFWYDRAIYFPGEAIRITISTTNPTSVPLEILDPEDAAFDDSPCHCEGWPVAIRSLVIVPGETIQRTVDSRDEKARSRSLLFRFTSPCSPPGTYQHSLFARPTVDRPVFKVGMPVLESSAVVWVEQHQRRETKRLAFAIVAARLEDPPEQAVGVMNGVDSPVDPSRSPVIGDAAQQGEHVLLISRQGETEGIVFRTPPGGILDPCTLGLWTRLLTAPATITSLSAIADRDGRITIDYGQADGMRHTLTLDAKHRPVAGR